MGKEKGPLRVPVQRKIMLLLWDHMKAEEDFEVPESVTQKGIGRELDLRQTHVSRALTELCNEGLVRSRTAHVKGEGRRKKVYFLTQKGVREVQEYANEIEGTKLPVRMRDGSLKLLQVSRVLKLMMQEGGKVSTMGELLNRYYDGSEVTLSMEGGPLRTQQRIPVNTKFFGRAKEIHQISKLVKDPGVDFISIISIAGQGKTSLMAEYTSRNPDLPAYWFSVDEWTRPSGILEDIAPTLETLGRTELIDHFRGYREPELERGVSSLVNDLRGTGLVIVFDDIHKNRSVMEFLNILKQRMPEGNGMTILTGSRKRPSFYRKRDVLEGGNVRELELYGLDPESAGELLKFRGVPVEEHELAYRKTSGHPLALELYIAGSDIDGYLWEEVTGSLDDREIDVLYLSSIYNQPMPQEAFFPGKVPDRELIDRLNERFLLKRFGDGNLGIHDLLREHLRERMAPMEVDRCLDRALGFLSTRGSERDILHRIMLLYEHDRDGITEALLKEGDFLVSKGHIEVLDMVPRIDPFPLRGADLIRYLLLFSDLNFRDGDLNSAETKIKRALEECDRVLSKKEVEKEEVLSLVSKLLFRSGEISRARGVLSKVVEAQRKNVAYNRKFGNKPGLGKALNNLSVAYLERGEVDKALDSFHEALSLFEESGDPRSKAFVEASIAEAYIVKRERGKGRKYLKRASSFHPRLPAINAKLKRRTGLCWSTLGDHEEALKDLREAYTSFIESNDPEAAVWVLLDLHELSGRMNDKKAALEYLERASTGVKNLKGPSEKRAELLLQCRKSRFDLISAQRSKKIGLAARELAEALIETMEPKRSVLYLDALIREMKNFEHIALVLKDFEELAWSKGDRNGSLVVSLRRASLLLEMGKIDEAQDLLRSIIRKGKKVGFNKVVRKAEILLG
ncbi:MAG: tetratricopeptide repeat protein [Thermoplasmatota archaeon]